MHLKAARQAATCAGRAVGVGSISLVGARGCKNARATGLWRGPQ
jgi:hypothetical protein